MSTGSKSHGQPWDFDRKGPVRIKTSRPEGMAATPVDVSTITAGMAQLVVEREAGAVLSPVDLSSMPPAPNPGFPNQSAPAVGGTFQGWMTPAPGASSVAPSYFGSMSVPIQEQKSGTVWAGSYSVGMSPYPVVAAPSVILEFFNRVLSYPPRGWEQIFAAAANELREVAVVLERDIKKHNRPIFPVLDDIFTAFYKTPFDRIRGVIVGQDPYPNRSTIQGKVCQATGMSFSVQAGEAIPKSLQNIMKKVEQEYPGVPTLMRQYRGDLSYLAEQGIFMLNSTLTVIEGIPNSQKRVWGGFLDYTFKAIRKDLPRTIFILWGSEAQKLEEDFPDAILVKGAHPVARGNQFFNDDYFTVTNELLAKRGEMPIMW